MNRFKNLMYAAVALNPAQLPITTGNAITLSEFQDRIGQIAQFLIVASMVVAVIFIVWGGLRYMFAMGDSTKAGEARSHIYHGLIGAGIILAIGVLLQTVAGIVSRTFFQ